MVKHNFLNILFCTIFLTLLSCNSTKETSTHPMMVAHRGCWFKGLVPENSIAAVEMAKRFGYAGIECDVHYTKDSVMVILHDKTLNRTTRRASDYEKLETPVRLCDLTYEELRRDYVLESSDPALRTPIPTLKELLTACKEYGVLPMLHSNLVESYQMAQQMLGDNWICFNGSDSLQKVARTISNCLVLLDPGAHKDQSARHTMARLNQIGGKTGVSTMKRQLLTQSYCDSLRQAGHQVQASIFPCPHENQAIRNGVSILLTDFSIMPNQNIPVWKEWETKDIVLLPQQEYKKVWGEVSGFGGITVVITFKGRIEVKLNNENTYLLERKEYGKDCIGLRFHQVSPTVEITAKDTTTIKQLSTSVYKL